jgi:hypothetical protein
MLRRFFLAAMLWITASPGALAAPPRAQAVIHLERGDGADYTRPRPETEGCLAEALEQRPAAAGFDGRVRFTVERDGRLTGLELLERVEPGVEEAVRAAFETCRWHEGRDPGGRPVVVQVTQPVRVRASGDEAEEAPDRATRASTPGVPPPPVAFDGAPLRLGSAQTASYRRPELADEACLPAALQRHREAAGLDATVKFAVMRDGSVTHFSFSPAVAPAVERAVVRAFEACTWAPALDPDGNPISVWVVQPLKVAGLPAPEPEAD